MQVASIIIFSILAVFVTWLIVDTTVTVYKKIRDKRMKKAQEEKKEVQVIENTDNQNKVD